MHTFIAGHTREDILEELFKYARKGKVNAISDIMEAKEECELKFCLPIIFDFINIENGKGPADIISFPGKPMDCKGVQYDGKTDTILKTET